MALHDNNMKYYHNKGIKLREGHEARFAAKLNKELPQKRGFGIYLKIAAAIAVLAGVGSIYFYLNSSFKAKPDNPGFVKQDSSSIKNELEKLQPANAVTLGDISPDLKKIEDYYVATINVTLLELDVDDANNQLFKGYMQKMSFLTKEYKTLTEELNEIGPNEQTVNALITNLQLRLQLLYDLKNKLNEFKKAKQNENNG